MTDKVVHTENRTQHLPKEDDQYDLYATHTSYGTETTSSSMYTPGMSLTSYYNLSFPWSEVLCPEDLHNLNKEHETVNLINICDMYMTD